jgi:LysM repeat protein
VGVVWLRIASQQRPEQAATDSSAGILPTNIPLITATAPITITAAATAVVTPAATPTPEVRSDGVIKHVVRQGETLLGIAGAYGVTVEDIQAANGLSDVLIRAGDELIVPVVQPDAAGASQSVASRFEYSVQQGDTIISIASRFGSTVQEIQQANNLAGDFILPGDVLTIPVPQVPPAVLASSPPSAPAQPNGENTSALLTPQPETIYIEPRLIGPPDGAAISRDEAPLLRWISVDVLDPNEWYVLLVYPVSGAATPLPSIWTKATSYHLEPELAPPEGQAAEYAWQVSVVRVKPGANSQYALEAASPPSELRRFTWR